MDQDEAAAIYADALELTEAVLATLPEHEPQRTLLSELFIRAHNLARAAGALATMLSQLQRHAPQVLRTIEEKTAQLALTYHAAGAAAPAAPAAQASGPLDHATPPQERIRAALAETSGAALSPDDPLPAQLAATLAHHGLTFPVVLLWIHKRPAPEFSALAFERWLRLYNFVPPEA